MAEQILQIQHGHCCGHSRAGLDLSGDLWEATVLGTHSQDLGSQSRTPVHPQGQMSGKRTDAKRRVRTTWNSTGSSASDDKDLRRGSKAAAKPHTEFLSQPILPPSVQGKEFWGPQFPAPPS